MWERIIYNIIIAVLLMSLFGSTVYFYQREENIKQQFLTELTYKLEVFQQGWLRKYCEIILRTQNEQDEDIIAFCVENYPLERP